MLAYFSSALDLVSHMGSATDFHQYPANQASG
jgi:hypothetical protein